MHRPFLQVPDPRLRQTALSVETVDQTVLDLWDEMLLAMYAMPGVGLAAPQLGDLRRVIVVDCSESKDQPVRMANPKFLTLSDEVQSFTEGSPNIPGHYAKVSRSSRVTIGYLDHTGQPCERVFESLWATSVQHQIDHLNGILFFDHLSATRRKMILNKHAKAGRRGPGNKGKP